MRVAQKTTINLKLPDPRRLWNLPVPVAITICVFSLLAISGLVGRIRSDAPAAAVQPTPALPVIIIQKEPAPPAPVVAQPAQPVAAIEPAAPIRYVVGFDSPNGRALGAIPAPNISGIVARFGDAWLQTTHDGAPIWIRASDLGLNIPDLMPAIAPQPGPRVVYVEQPAAPVEQPYQPEQQPEQQAAPTPAQEYQVLTERQRNIQEHYVDIPAIAPMEMNPVNQEWARVQGCAEHPEWHC